MSDAARGGRPRDAKLDAAILDAARAVLLETGVDGLTYERVAAAAKTTRPAVYRRYPSRLDLVIEALATLGSITSPKPRGDHFADLVAELTAFRDAVTRTQSMTLVGSMLLATTDETAKRIYRERVVQPRRVRIADILASARADGAITAPPAEQAAAVTMCSGSWYAYALADESPPGDWPHRTATLVWRALGGLDPQPP